MDVSYLVRVVIGVPSPRRATDIFFVSGNEQLIVWAKHSSR
jgi:hypothetical protein